MSDTNLELVRRGYEAFARGDIPGLLELLDEKIEWVTPGPAELPTSGRRTGRAQVAEFFTAVNDVLDIQRFEPRHFIEQDNRIVVLGEETGRVRATGKVLEFAWAHVFTISDGKVVAFQEYIDTAAVVAELRSAHAAV